MRNPVPSPRDTGRGCCGAAGFLRRRGPCGLCPTSGIRRPHFGADPRLPKAGGWKASRNSEVNLYSQRNAPTPVGKIFKPALRWDAIRRVYQAELKALSNLVDSIDVKVAEDKVHGSLATLTIKSASGISEKEIKDRVNEILARYTVQYRLAIKM